MSSSNLLRLCLVFAVVFLPLAGSVSHRERESESGMTMGAPVNLLVDSAKTRASVAGTERIILYLPSLYTNYFSYSYNASPEDILSSIFFSKDLSQWQRWQV